MIMAFWRTGKMVLMHFTNRNGAPVRSGPFRALRILETVEQLGLSTDQLVGQALGWCSNLGGDIMRTGV